MDPKTRKRLASAVVSASLVLSACGGGSDVVTSDALTPDTDTTGGAAEAPAETNAPNTSAASAEQAATDTEAPADSGDDTTAATTPEPEPVVSVEDAAAAASANRDSLTITDDARTTEVLNVKTGGKSTLQDVVVGDRPVLLWFFSPH